MDGGSVSGAWWVSGGPPLLEDSRAALKQLLVLVYMVASSDQLQLEMKRGLYHLCWNGLCLGGLPKCQNRKAFQVVVEIPLLFSFVNMELELRYNFNNCFSYPHVSGSTINTKLCIPVPMRTLAGEMPKCCLVMGSGVMSGASFPTPLSGAKADVRAPTI